MTALVREQDGEQRGGKRRALRKERGMHERILDQVAERERVVGRDVRRVIEPVRGHGQVRFDLRLIDCEHAARERRRQHGQRKQRRVPHPLARRRARRDARQIDCFRLEDRRDALD